MQRTQTLSRGAFGETKGIFFQTILSKPQTYELTPKNQAVAASGAALTNGDSQPSLDSDGNKLPPAVAPPGPNNNSNSPLRTAHGGVAMNNPGVCSFALPLSPAHHSAKYVEKIKNAHASKTRLQHHPLATPRQYSYIPPPFPYAVPMHQHYGAIGYLPYYDIHQGCFIILYIYTLGTKKDANLPLFCLASNLGVEVGGLKRLITQDVDWMCAECSELNFGQSLVCAKCQVGLFFIIFPAHVFRIYIRLTQKLDICEYEKTPRSFEAVASTQWTCPKCAMQVSIQMNACPSCKTAREGAPS